MVKTLNIRELSSEVDDEVISSTKEVGFHFGEVVGESDSYYAVKFENSTQNAVKSISCLVMPRVGDYAACLSDGKRLFISEVLERTPDHEKIEIQSDRPFQVSAPEISVMGAEQLVLTSREGELNFHKLSLRALKLEATAENATTAIKSLTHVGKVIKTTISDMLLRAATSLRIIDGADHQRAEETHIIAEKFLSVRGELTSVAAKKDVKIDGKRVHIG